MLMANLNAQGLARRDPLIMDCIEADTEKTFVSVDLSAGEPTATSHYSGDKNYFDANFGMVGKRPYFDKLGVLKIDDIYLTCASFSPMGRREVKEAFEATYNGVSAFDQWLINPEVIKNEIKEIRALHKILVLGIGYSMGPRKMVQSCYDKGYSLGLADARSFFNAYWSWCPKVKALAAALELKFKTEGHLINDFGYRLVPDREHKAFNYWIQSTVSGIMNVLTAKFFSICPQAEFVTVIHDELIFQIDNNLLEESRKCMIQATESLNNDLNWTVKIRTGFVSGSTHYTAK
jgi:hypothetical protein